MEKLIYKNLKPIDDYAVYNRETYSVYRDKSTALLRSYDKKDEEIGFKKYQDYDLYIKEVPYSELDDLYSLDYDAMYKGERVSVLAMGGNISNIFSNNREVINKLGLKTTSDKFIHQMDNVPNDELEFIPVKTDLIGRYKN